MPRSKKLDSAATASLHPDVLPKLEQKVALLKNLAQQPASSHLLVMATSGTPTYHAVDRMVTQDKVAYFYQADELIFASRVDAPWAMIKRDRLIEITEGDLARHYKADSDSQEGFWKSLAPKEFKAAQEQEEQGPIAIPLELLEQLQGTGRPAKKVRTDDKPSPGQYL